MSYIDIGDMNAAYGADRVIDITGNNTEQLSAAILSSTNTINRYLRNRYTVPFTIFPEELKDIACDLAWYYLWRTNELIPEAVALRFKDAIKALQELANGITKLDIDTETTTGVIYSKTRTMTYNSDWEADYLYANNV